MSSSFASLIINIKVLILWSFFIRYFLQIFILWLYSFWMSFSFSNYSYNVAFFFSYVINLNNKLLTSRFKFPAFKLTITMVWNNSIILSACNTSIATSSIDLGVLVYVMGFLDPSPKDPNFYIIILDLNSNGCPFLLQILGLLAYTCGSKCANMTHRRLVCGVVRKKKLTLSEMWQLENFVAHGHVSKSGNFELWTSFGLFFRHCAQIFFGLSRLLTFCIMCNV